jgi:hypothetical protein
LHVAALRLGDRICRGSVRRVGGEGTGLLFVQSATVLEALAAMDADPATPLFNLLLDGDHSYVADGWIVHNKEAGSGGIGSAGGGSDAGGSDSGASDGGSADDGGSDGSGSEGGAQAGADAHRGAASDGERTEAQPQPGEAVLDSFMDALGVDDPRGVGLEPAGPPLSVDQERRVIERRWLHPE